MKTLDLLMPRPLKTLGRHPDVVLAAGVAAIVSMLILPLPSMLLDGLLASNLALAAVILVAILLSPKPLSVSTFPTLLLITTLFRLALNVSTTRMILAKGTAGGVVEAFGHFVIRGDVVVGLVVFLVITLVQFLVIGKGAERVAEVGARFTLDAMPGKQMSIDAAVRSGAIDENEAQAKRAELGRESQFYGAMDGAMKFVKGDAIAGLIITALNLVAGLIIGVMRNGLSVGEAAETYTLLTVGDGLVSQIPALLITLSAGVLTTRVASADEVTDLGGSLQAELLSSPKVLAIGGAFALALGLVPGLPVLPFLAISTVLFVASWSRRRALERPVPLEAAKKLEEKFDKQMKQAKKQQALADQVAPSVAPVSLDCGVGLSQTLGLDDPSCELVETVLRDARDSLYMNTGVRFPAVVVRKNSPSIDEDAYVVRIKDVPVLEGSFPKDRVLLMESPERLARLGVPVERAPEPFGRHGASVAPADMADVLRDAGIPLRSAEEAVTMVIMDVLRRHATHFLGLQDVAELVERLEKVYPTLVKEVVPKLISLSQLADILRRLVDEDVNIRDLKSVLECLADTAALGLDRVELTERVRAALYLQIAHQHTGMEKKVNVVTLDPSVEDAIEAGIEHTAGGSYLALDPEIQTAIVSAVARTLAPLLKNGQKPLILTNRTVRRYLHMLIARRMTGIVVLSYFELPEHVDVSPIGRVTLNEELPEAA